MRIRVLQITPFACGVALCAILAPAFASANNVAQLRERYQSARARLLQQGYREPDRIAEVIAPRLIQYVDWDQDKRDYRIRYNPWLVYCPSPATWGAWESGAALTDRIAASERAAGRVSSLTAGWLKKLWSVVMPPGAGAPSFRARVAQGPQWTRAWSFTETQIDGLRDLSERGLIRWTGVDCIDGAPSPVTLKPTTKFFRGADGTARQCGYLTYADPSVISDELARLEREWAAWPGGVLAHPVEAAAYFQRQLIAIHPFENGNGRVSRLVMDRVAIASGLPAPLLADMNQDLTSGARVWEAEIERGIERAVSELERCAADPRALGCQEVSRERPTTIPEGACRKEF